MLKALRISNIVLIENAELVFSDGFHVLTGETGSGKSAIIGALKYIAGARADNTILRHEKELGTIEAAFDISSMPHLHDLLNASGISHDPEDELIIKREIVRSGRSRAFVNNQLAQTTLLKQLAEKLIEIIGQHANQRLMNLSEQRHILDLFAENQPLRQQYRVSWTHEISVRKELLALMDSEAVRLRDIETLQMQVKEIEASELNELEEEELFAEYTRLTSSEEISRNAERITNGLSGDETPIIAALMEIQKSYEELVTKDPTLGESLEAFKSAVLEIEETSHTIRNYHAHIEYNPERIQEIDARLKEITALKRKYGGTVSDVLSYGKTARQKLEQLEAADLKIEELEKELAASKETTDDLAQKLTASRVAAGEKLQKAMKTQLRALNMQKAEFYVSITTQKRSQDGDDLIELYFRPNIGEDKLSIKECASGGELSRIQLALQTLLAKKVQTPTLIFDEIDANIGGETACVIGEKLQEIGHGHQVLCITHFPQVAKCAKHHIQISKNEKKGRTISEIFYLNESKRKLELSRMAGKKLK